MLIHYNIVQYCEQKKTLTFLIKHSGLGAFRRIQLGRTLFSGMIINLEVIP